MRKARARPIQQGEDRRAAYAPRATHPTHELTQSIIPTLLHSPIHSLALVRLQAGAGGASSASAGGEDGKLICVIGDEETVTGFLLAGVGHRTVDHCNYLIVKPETKVSAVEEAFRNFTSRADAGIILINQHIANDIRHLMANYTQTIPTILEIPSKNHPYDPKKDYIMTRVNQMLGHQG